MCIDDLNDFYSPNIKRANVEHCMNNKNFKFFEIDIRDKEGIEKRIQDKKLRRNLGENAKLYVAEHHSWSKALNIYLNVFNELLQKG